MCSQTVPLLQERIYVDRNSRIILLLQEGVSINHHSLIAHQEWICIGRHTLDVLLLQERIGIYHNAPLLNKLRVTVKAVTARLVLEVVLPA